MESFSATENACLVEIPPMPNNLAGQYDECAEVTIHGVQEERCVILEPDVAEYFLDSESVTPPLPVAVRVTALR